MIDAKYFKDQLPRDVAALGDLAVVEVRLKGNQFHRVHKVLEIRDSYVSLEAYDFRGGETTAYSFFAGEPRFPLVFRKRSLHPGSAIGYHRNDEDEIYYVIAGRGELTLNGERHEVGPGTAIMTRAGNSHGLRQVGSED